MIQYDGTGVYEPIKWMTAYHRGLVAIAAVFSETNLARPSTNSDLFLPLSSWPYGSPRPLGRRGVEEQGDVHVGSCEAMHRLP